MCQCVSWKVFLNQLGGSFFVYFSLMLKREEFPYSFDLYFFFYSRWRMVWAVTNNTYGKKSFFRSSILPTPPRRSPYAKMQSYMTISTIWVLRAAQCAHVHAHKEWRSNLCIMYIADLCIMKICALHVKAHHNAEAATHPNALYTAKYAIWHRTYWMSLRPTYVCPLLA